MSKDNKKGFINLAKKSLSVLAASIAALSQNEAQAETFTKHATQPNSDNFISAAKSKLKPKLVLKLNMNQPDNSVMAMHTSHSSHSSHASHSSHSSGYTPVTPGHYSHSSHASHYSSSPSYTPSTTPTYTIPKQNPVATYTSVDTTRVLYKGCKGADVTELQKLLKAKGFTTPVSGYFGEQTEIAVKKFQKSVDLPADGKAGSMTISMLKE